MKIDKKEKDWVYSDGFKRYKEGLNDLWDYNYKSDQFKLAEKISRRNKLEWNIKMFKKYNKNGYWLALWTGKKFVHLDLTPMYIYEILKEYEKRLEKLDNPHKHKQLGLSL